MSSVFELFRLDKKVAIVTGGHAWLGHDIACAFAEAGADIVLTSRNVDSIKPTAAEIARKYGVEALAVTLDQRDYKSVAEMTETAFSWKGHIDILVNNAGGGSGASEGNLFSRAPEDIQSMLDVNLTGMIFCCKAVGAHMMVQKSGKIINLGSIAGLVGRDREMYRRTDKMEQPVDYSAAKGGVISITRDLAALMTPEGICVNSISPGGFDKGDLPKSFVDAYSDKTPLGRMGRMGVDIKGGALLLASPAGDYISGHNLVVDGGFSIWK